MEDYGSRYAESRLRILDAKLRRVYRQAEKELEEKLKQFSEKKKKKNALLLKKLDAGEITEQYYKDWLAGQAFIEKQWKQKVEQATALLQHANEEALAIVRGEQLNVFAENANYQAYELEQDFRGAYSFNIYDKKTVENLVTNKPELLPPKKVNGRKDRAWNQGIIANCVTQGIIQGESIDKITKRIAKDTASHDMKAMRRYARTAMTSAQNAGRMEVLNRAQDMGIKVQKQWLSAHDSRTRDSHRMLDGDIKDINKPFHGDFSDIMYPGDPSAHPAEVYNCRCRMTYVYPDYQKYDTDQDWRDREEIDGLSYEDWKESKKPSTILEQDADDFGNPIGKPFEIKRAFGEKIKVDTKVVEDFAFPDGNWNGVHSRGKAYEYSLPNGMKIYYKADMDKTKQDLDPRTLIQAYYNVPQEIRDRGQKKIVVVDYQNPMDGYWAKRFHWKGFKSYMNGGDDIDIWEHTGHEFSRITTSLAHEAGHMIDRKNGDISQTKEWRSAKTKDLKVSKQKSPRSYGEKNDVEDFAVSVEKYATEAEWMRANFPNRTAIIDRILGVHLGGK